MLLLVRRVVGQSMEPALAAGKLVVAIPARRFTVGQVIIFNHDHKEKIKRVSAVRGHALYVLGDNPIYSTDSRSFGWIEQQAVLGRVVVPWRLRRQA